MFLKVQHSISTAWHDAKWQPNLAVLCVTIDHSETVDVDNPGCLSCAGALHLQVIGAGHKYYSSSTTVNSAHNRALHNGTDTSAVSVLVPETESAR